MNEQEKYNWMVYVSCMTFNHALYIVDAMNGFTMQETDFPFVCAVVDDASTDGEQEVIKNYLNEHFDLEDKAIVQHEETDDYNLIFARHKTNMKCYFAVIYLKYNHYSIKKSKVPYLSQWRYNAKYIAICEGDDYWIDSTKLQKQFDYMEQNPDCSMCFHNAINFFVQKRKLSLFNDFECDRDLTAHEAIHDWKVPTASTFFRTFYSDNPEWMAKIYSGDYSRILHALSGGRIYGFSKFMSVYRKNTEGMSASARMKGKNIFVLEQQYKLLESYNKGTNYLYDSVISNRLFDLQKEIRFNKIKKISFFLCVLDPVFYEKVYKRIKYIISEIK